MVGPNHQHQQCRGISTSAFRPDLHGSEGRAACRVPGLAARSALSRITVNTVCAARYDCQYAKCDEGSRGGRWGFRDGGCTRAEDGDRRVDPNPTRRFGRPEEVPLRLFPCVEAVLPITAMTLGCQCRLLRRRKQTAAATSSGRPEAARGVGPHVGRHPSARVHPPSRKAPIARALSFITFCVLAVSIVPAHTVLTVIPERRARQQTRGTRHAARPSLPCSPGRNALG